MGKNKKQFVAYFNTASLSYKGYGTQYIYYILLELECMSITIVSIFESQTSRRLYS